MSLQLSVIIYTALLLLLAVISAMETAIHSVGSLENRIERAGGGMVGERLRRISQNPFSQLQQALLLSAALNLALAALGLQRPSPPVAEAPTARPATTNDAAEELLNQPGETASGEDDRRG